jgi:hypothetical protein
MRPTRRRGPIVSCAKEREIAAIRRSILLWESFYLLHRNGKLRDQRVEQRRWFFSLVGQFALRQIT